MRRQIHTTYDHLLELSRPTVSDVHRDHCLAAHCTLVARDILVIWHAQTDGGSCDAAGTEEAMELGIGTGSEQAAQGAACQQQTSSGPSLRQRRRAQQVAPLSHILPRFSANDSWTIRALTLWNARHVHNDWIAVAWSEPLSNNAGLIDFDAGH